jgi:hypothetical protein
MYELPFLMENWARKYCSAGKVVTGELYAELDKEFHFNFDPCPFMSADKTFLFKDWSSSVYCNPPYDNIYNQEHLNLS